MSRPGTRLRSFAQRFCDPATMERLIDPAIADLQCEHAEAVRLGQQWRSRWVRIAGYLAFWKVAAIVIGGTTRELSTADGGAVGRAIRFSGIATTVTVAILVWEPLRWSPAAISDKIGMLIVYLLPQALTVAIPVGLVFGVLCGLRGGALTLRSKRAIVLLLLAASLAALVLSGWLLPAGNQAYRELTFALMHPGDGGRVPRGMNELTLGELMSKNTYQFHFRLALACAPLVLGLFSLTIATARRGRFGSLAVIATAAATCFGYYVLLFSSREQALGAHLPAAIAAWAPNLVFAVLTLALHLRRHEPSAADPSRLDDDRQSGDRPVSPQA